MCRYALASYKQHYACFDCRKTYKRRMREDYFEAPIKPAAKTVSCPQCQRPMSKMGLDFQAPPQNDLKQWLKVKVLYFNGYAFHSCGCNGPGQRPAKLSEVESFLATHKQVGAERNRRRAEEEKAIRKAAKTKKAKQARKKETQEKLKQKELRRKKREDENAAWPIIAPKEHAQPELGSIAKFVC